MPASEYSFGITDVASAVSTAKLLENTGAAAYLTAGATIATVETRHASYLNLLNRTSPFPAAFDKALAPRRICETVREAFITSSPSPYGPYKSLEALCMRLPNRPTPQRPSDRGLRGPEQQLWPFALVSGSATQPSAIWLIADY